MIVLFGFILSETPSELKKEKCIYIFLLGFKTFGNHLYNERNILKNVNHSFRKTMPWYLLFKIVTRLI